MKCVLTLGGDTEAANGAESGYLRNIYGQLLTLGVSRYHISNRSRSERSEVQRIVRPLRQVLPYNSDSVGFAYGAGISRVCSRW